MKSTSMPGLKVPGEDDADTGFWSPAPSNGIPTLATSSANDPVEISQKPALVSEAVESSGAQSGAITVTSLTAGGITINLLFDAAAMAAPASFRAGIQQAASLLTAAISDQITVNIKIDYSGTGGGAAAGPDNGLYESYSSIRAALINHATSGDPVFNALSAGTSIQGQSSVAVWNAQLKLFGLLGANDTTTDDGSATFATDINSNLLVGVALHELTHAMGRVPYGSPYSTSPDIFDLFRFTSAGTRLFDGSSTAPAAYFSIDGGATKLADYGQNSDPSDFLNSGVQGAADPFNEYYGGGTIQGLTAVDNEQLDALGFHTIIALATTVIEAFGSTGLVQVAKVFFLNSNATGSGPSLKLSGTAVVAGQLAAWTPIGAEQTAAGYEVAWKNGSADQYTVWNADSSGNYLTNAIGSVSGSSVALESLESSFHQDLNGDGVIGVLTKVIEAFGVTSLTQTGSTFSLLAGGSGPSLKLSGTTVVAGQLAAWTPIGAEQTATGYEIAWKNGSADQYTVWNTDSSGNYLTNAIGSVSGSSVALESLESSFHQDLNGDGVIGVLTKVIEAFGVTSLTQTDSTFSLFAGGSGPSLKLSGTAVVAGQLAAWTPIGAEKTATGYEIAWKNGSADQYTVWNTDSSGNYLTNAVGSVSGSSVALESLESSFHQDLNGDGVIGVLTKVIEAFGVTSLTQTDSTFSLLAGGSGPSLKLSGTAVVAGQLAAWTPIGAEQTATGYEIAWKNGSADQYTVWNTDSSGNYLTNAVGLVSGSSVALESLESSFHQDLNGDGVIGVPISASPQTASVVVANNDTFIFRPGLGTQLVTNASTTATFELDGFSSVTSDGQLAALLHDAQTGLTQTLFQPTPDGHGTVLDFGNHDSVALLGIALATLHASNFIIH